MRYLFTAYTLLAFTAGCLGAAHQFALSAVSLLVTAALWAEYKKRRDDPHR